MASMDELRRSVGPEGSEPDPAQGRKEQFGEGRAGVVIGISILGGIGVFLAAIFLISVWVAGDTFSVSTGMNRSLLCTAMTCRPCGP